MTLNPWHVVRNGEQLDIHMIVGPDGEAPRELVIASNVRTAEAARKMAAAQEMYEALFVIVRGYDLWAKVNPDFVAAIIGARHALGKAVAG